jgi:hypothetical protein
MTTKTKKITLLSMGNLTGLKADDRFKVKTIQESVEFLPDQVLSRPEVFDLCQSKGWSVTIVGLKAEG